MKDISGYLAMDTLEEIFEAMGHGLEDELAPHMSNPAMVNIAVGKVREYGSAWDRVAEARPELCMKKGGLVALWKKEFTSQEQPEPVRRAFAYL